MLYIIVLIVGLVLGFVASSGAITINHNYTYPTPQAVPVDTPSPDQDAKELANSVAAVMQDLMGVENE